MGEERLYHYECKNPKCERTYALRDVVLTGTLNRPTCARSKVVDVMIDRNTRETVRKEIVYYVCGPRPCRRNREDICHCGTPFDWPTRPATVSKDSVSPEFQDLLDRMWFDEDFASGVSKLARDYSNGIRTDVTGLSVDPDLIELEIEVEVSEAGSEIGDLDQDLREEDELVA